MKLITLSNMTKFFFKSLLLLFWISPISITLSCASFGINSNFVGIGSNSVSPLIMGQGSIMTKNPIGQYIYQNTGSGDGYKSQMKNPENFEADFGMTSSRKNPLVYSNGDGKILNNLVSLWRKKKLRTITYAFDAIAIGINLPIGMQLKNNSKVPVINLQSLANLYSKDAQLAELVTWSLLIENELSPLKWQNKKPIAIGIEGGKKTSGKAETFVNMIDAKLDSNAKNPNQKSVIRNQDFSFTDNFNDIYTKNQSTSGSIAYYSLGQISNAKLNNIFIAAIDELNDDPTKKPTVKMVQAKKYKWSRPFNIIYSVDNIKSVAFANYLLSTKAQKFIEEKNFVGLASNQIIAQLPTWLPDLDYQKNGTTIKGVNGKNLNGLTINYGL